MSVTVKYKFQATVIETLGSNTDSASATRRKVIHDQFDEFGTLTSATSVPVTTVAEAVVALSGGAKTIDLTALTGTNGATVSMSGLKVQIFRFKNLGANQMTIVGGAANGYLLWGASGSVIVPAGGIVQFFGNETLADVDGTHKNIDVSGTAAQTFELTVIAG